MKELTISAQFDAETHMWWVSNDELPLTTEASSLDALAARVKAIAPEIAALNGLVAEGEELKIHLTTDLVTISG